MGHGDGGVCHVGGGSCGVVSHVMAARGLIAQLVHLAALWPITVRSAVRARAGPFSTLCCMAYKFCKIFHVTAVGLAKTIQTTISCFWLREPAVPLAVWSCGMILASSARGPGFNAQNSPLAVQPNNCSAR